MLNGSFRDACARSEMSNMNQSCPTCGQRLPTVAQHGLCPRCLLAEFARETETAASPGARVRYFGDYELQEEIAQGGMGVVYRARQVSLNRPVALKMILTGQLATSAEVERFHLEAEAVAKLDHPNIVPVYEVGEHQGRHYFSMKLIDGGDLADRSTQRRWPPADAALLMVKIARAVHYAHQRGVLHRDIKPTNILIDATGEPYLSDFGLAKLVERESSLTESMALIGSASYMAPEQAAGHARDLTIAADIYSLGAVLFHMLTGRPPFQGATLIETLKQVSERSPEPPQKLNPAVDRDLSTICLKCLEKGTSDRYESADALAGDIDRWLKHMPIFARPAPPLERAQKWARRHPAVAMLSAGCVALFLVGFSLVTWKWREAERAWGVSRESEAKANRINKFLIEDLLQQAFTENNPAGSNITLRAVLDKAAARAGHNFGELPEVEAEVAMTIGSVYLSLGANTEADAHLQRSLALRGARFGADHPETLKTLDRIATLYQAQGKIEEAEHLFRRVLQARTGLSNPELISRAQSMNNLGVLLLEQGRFHEAERELRKALSLSLAASGPDGDLYPTTLASLALTLERLGKFDEAHNFAARAMKLSSSVYGPNHPNTFSAMNSYATVAQKLGRLREAEPIFREVVARRREIEGPTHWHTLNALNNLAVCLLEMENAAGAEHVLKEAIGGSAEIASPNDSRLLQFRNNFAFALLRQGKTADAEAIFFEVLNIRRKAPGPLTSALADTLGGLGEALLTLGKYVEAEALVDEAIVVYGKTLPGGHLRTLQAQSLKAECMALRGDFAAAENLALTSWRSVEKIPELAAGQKQRVLNRIIHIYQAWNKSAEAERWIAVRNSL